VAVGDELELDAVVGAPGTKGRLTRVRVSVVEGPEGWGEEAQKVGTTYRIAWQALGFPSWSLRGERVQEIEVLATGCRFSSWETMAGPLAGVVRGVVGGGLDRAFERFVGEVRGWWEGMGGRGRGRGRGLVREEDGKGGKGGVGEGEVRGCWGEGKGGVPGCGGGGKGRMGSRDEGV